MPGRLRRAGACFVQSPVPIAVALRASNGLTARVAAFAAVTVVAPVARRIEFLLVADPAPMRRRGGGNQR